MTLAWQERRARDEAEGLLILHHGRGSDEEDLLPLADVFDPAQRLHVVSVRAPLTIPGFPGHHWYVVQQVGYPDPSTFAEAYRQLAATHDELWRQTGIGPERTVLGGFSMGTVMSYSMAFGADRPVVAGVLAFSGFIPIVDSWQPDFEQRSATPVLISHGRADPVITIDYALRARKQLEDSGVPVTLQQSGLDHTIDPVHASVAAKWLGGLPVLQH